jgi:diaminopimelate decarboxylase
MADADLLEVVNHRIVIGNVAVDDLVGKYGSPLFAYVSDSIRRRISIIKDAIKYPRLHLSYAVRANPLLAILRLLYKEGAAVTAASAGEVMSAFKVGFAPHQILAIADLLTDSEMEFCHDRNVQLSFGSCDAITRFGTHHREQKIILRVSPGKFSGEGLAWNDVFGFRPEAMDSAVEQVKEYGLRVVGIHASDSVETTNAKRILERFDAIFDAAARFEDITYINIGGGLGVAIRTSDEELDIYGVGEVLTKRMSEYAGKTRKPVTLVVEPGRYLVSDAGFLFTKVIAMRSQGGVRKAVTDASTHLLPDLRLQNRYYEIVNATNPEGTRIPVLVAGCATDSGDNFTLEPREIAEVRTGDILAVRSAGAYAMALAGVFNMRPRPAEVMLEDGRERLVRRRETIADLLRNQEM